MEVAQVSRQQAGDGERTLEAHLLLIKLFLWIRTRALDGLHCVFIIGRLTTFNISIAIDRLCGVKVKHLQDIWPRTTPIGSMVGPSVTKTHSEEITDKTYASSMSL